MSDTRAGNTMSVWAADNHAHSIINNN